MTYGRIKVHRSTTCSTSPDEQGIETKGKEQLDLEGQARVQYQPR